MITDDPSSHCDSRNADAHGAETPAARAGARSAQFAPGDVVRIRTERWRVTTHLPFGDCALVDVTGADAANTGQRARFVLPFEPVERIVRDTRALVVRPARWRRVACAHLGEASPSPIALRSAARAAITLMPFQLEPALAITRGMATRLLIADAVGLGKTIQAGLVIAEVLARTGDGHALVITPAGLRDQWLRELHSRFAIDAGIVDATTIAHPEHHGNPWTMHGVAIASIDYVKRAEVMRGLEDMVWDVVVFDEAHWLAGHSDRAKAASGLVGRGRVIVALTATPHGGDEDAFARLCDLGRLAGDGPIAFFRRTRLDTGLSDTRRMRWVHVMPTEAETRMHRALDAYARAVWHADLSAGARLAMIVLARRACSSPHALVRSIVRRLDLLSTAADAAQLTLPLEPIDSDDEPAAELATPGLRNAERERRHLEEILRLARLSCKDDSKVARLQRLLSRTTEPAIVFTEYRDTLEHLAQALRKHDCVQLHGGMTLAERRASVRCFTSKSVRLLLATDAGSEGLNLHHRCRLVVNLEVPWTPLRVEQRIGRVDRIGQQRRVHAVHLIARGTPEQDILRQLIDREWRARASLDAISHLDAAAIAGAAIGDGSIPLRKGDSLPPSPRVSTLDLATAAVEEADRLETVRRLLRRAGDTVVHRPAVAVVPRRAVVARACWAYLLTILGPEDEWLWHTIVGVTKAIPIGRIQSVGQVRAITAALSGASSEIVDPTRAGATSMFLAAIRPSLVLAAARERAIHTHITSHRSTMAAALVQRGLFGAREERLAAAESARLDAALDRCAARLRALRRLERAHTSEPQLAFAVLTR